MESFSTERHSEQCDSLLCIPYPRALLRLQHQSTQAFAQETGEEVICHIIPSGEKDALCGEKNAKGSSLEMYCNCSKCYEIAEKKLAEPAEVEE